MDGRIEESKFEKKKKKTRIIKKVVKLIHLHHEIAGKKGRSSFVPSDSNREGLHDISMDQIDEENANGRGSMNSKLNPKQYRNYRNAPKEKESINNIDEIKLSPINRKCVVLDKSMQI
jgi:hypothetical protein